MHVFYQYSYFDPLHVGNCWTFIKAEILKEEVECQLENGR